MLRSSFRSYGGLKKTIKLDLMSGVIRYDLDKRSSQLKYISEQKWMNRCEGRIYRVDLR